jgi:hypothetical protein
MPITERYYGKTHFKPVTPAHSDGVLYTVGDVLGGVQEILMSSHGRGGLVRRVVILDRQNLAPDLRLFFFRENPSAGAYADNAPLALNVADMANYIGHEDVVSWETDGVLSWTILKEINQEYRLESGNFPAETRFWVIPQINTGVTYTGAGKLTFTYAIWPD